MKSSHDLSLRKLDTSNTETLEKPIDKSAFRINDKSISTFIITTLRIKR